LILADLRGPLSGDPREELIERPSMRYVLGTLAPQREILLPEKDEDLASSDEEDTEQGPAESPAAARPVLLPSSLGLTFAVELSCPALAITVRWGRYERGSSETQVTEKGNPKTVWKRAPFEATSHSVPLTAGDIAPWSPDTARPAVQVRGRVRAHADTWLVTLFLVNGQEPPDEHRDHAWLFQCELEARATDGVAAFVRKSLPAPDPARVDPRTREEDLELEMLYRHELEFAVGHGVGADWAEAPADRTHAVAVRTESAPSFDVPRVDPVTAKDVPDLAGVEFNMMTLSGLDGAGLARALRPLANAYENWTKGQRIRAEAGEDGLAHHTAAAQRALQGCARALGRMREGVALLERDGMEAEAFRVANRAMALHRQRGRVVEDRRAGGGVSEEASTSRARDLWHPFQLAFILLNLPSVADLHHPDRSDPEHGVGDLLWFPTGGGKTEAYLGLAAFTMVLRRLQGEVGGRRGEHGVAVLMRYTLRLLTVQQFQRAAALVCALEVLRRERIETGDMRLGREPFRIGLWVGMKTTPNTTAASAEAVERARKQTGEYAGSHSLQLSRCPWCGHSLSLKSDVRVELYPGGRAHTFASCSDPRGGCPFTAAQSDGQGIPIVTVDEEIYRRLPALLISTVDKFARMPWAGETQMLFGRVDAKCSRHGFVTSEIEDAGRHNASAGARAAQQQAHGPLRPPDLIIQDELHLISGPLGSLVGLYETALEALCTWEVDGRRVRPKLIASTATIRRADQQMRDLFARRLDVFPPQGLDVADNFFAIRRKPSAENPGRRYLAICATGRRVKGTYIRAYVAAMLAAQTQYEKWDRHADPWMTLVGYFNTLRDLGGMRRVVEDDVRQRIERGDQLGFRRRLRPEVAELTSRMPSARIPRVLEQLELRFSRAGAEERRARRERNELAGPPPIDVLLATSMVSVGVDVPRLGLMVVAGQPKTTSEYIQATSRVGRNHPGLVLVVLNWARPRDLSHFERFHHFHATFYRHVEALSVTPFSPRALDRGLSAVLVSLVRLGGSELNGNAAAQAFRRDHPVVRNAVETIVGRVEQVVGDRERADEVRRMLDKRVDAWSRAARQSASQASRLGYESRPDGATAGLLQPAEVGGWETFTCLNALRDVEPSVSLVLDDFGLDDLPEEQTS
jgi:hypothetical protein